MIICDYLWLFAIILTWLFVIICIQIIANNQQIITNMMCTASSYFQSLGRCCSLIVCLKARIHCSSSESPMTFFASALGSLNSRRLAPQILSCNVPNPAVAQIFAIILELIDFGCNCCIEKYGWMASRFCCQKPFAVLKLRRVWNSNNYNNDNQYK